MEVTYEELPAIFDPVQALENPQVVLYGVSNLACEHLVVKGDMEKGFQQADVVLERTYTTQAIQHSAIECDAVVTVQRTEGSRSTLPANIPTTSSAGWRRAAGWIRTV